MAGYQGDYLVGEVIPLWYDSFNSLGASTTPSSIGTVVVYRGSDVTGTSVGVSTHSIGWNGKAGLNLAVITSSASAAFYSIGQKFRVIASLTTIDGQLVNVPVGDFTIQKTYQAGLIHRGVAGGGAAGSITLDSTVRSATTSLYNGSGVFLSGGTGAGQANEGSSYAGATGVLTTSRNWPATNPASGTSYELYAGSLSLSSTEIQSGLTAGTADALLGRNIAGGSDGGRTVSSALYPLRNKVTVGGSTMTVFQTDDSTSEWTASITTAGSALNSIDPA